MMLRSKNGSDSFYRDQFERVTLLKAPIAPHSTLSAGWYQIQKHPIAPVKWGRLTYTSFHLFAIFNPWSYVIRLWQSNLAATIAPVFRESCSLSYEDMWNSPSPGYILLGPSNAITPSQQHFFFGKTVVVGTLIYMGDFISDDTASISLYHIW